MTYLAECSAMTALTALMADKQFVKKYFTSQHIALYRNCGGRVGPSNQLDVTNEINQVIGPITPD